MVQPSRSARAAEPQLILDRGVALVVGGIAGVECDLHDWTSSVGEAAATLALPFGFDEFSGSLMGKQADQFNDARIALRRIGGRRTVGRFENHPYPLLCCPLRPRHLAILVFGRIVPPETKGELESG